MIVALTAQAPPNLPVVAGFYSQLAGVLAGFAFAGLIALIAAQMTADHASETLEGGAPLLAAFLALVLSSLNYAVVAGESPGTARVAALQTASGLGFGVAGLMLLYSILVLVRGLEIHAARSKLVSRAMANMIRSVIVFVASPLIILLVWSGVRDHLTQKYGAEVGFTGADWVSLLVLVLSLAVGVCFAVRLFGDPQHHPSLTRFLSAAVVGLASFSLLSTTLLISFTGSDTSVSDLVPMAAIVLVGTFALVLSYSASRFCAGSSKA